MTMAVSKIGTGISAGRRVARLRRHFRLRKKVRGTATRPRLVVTRSARHLYAQVVDDARGVTLVSASTYKLDAGGDKRPGRRARRGGARRRAGVLMTIHSSATETKTNERDA